MASPLYPITDGMKRCSGCLELKPVAAFYADPAGAEGLRARCNRCCSAYRRAKRAQPGVRNRPPGISAEERRARAKIAQLKAVYGLTARQFNAMIRQQNGQCSICDVPFTAEIRPYVDHDHETEEVRGLLCRQCNIGIGHLKDDPRIVARALQFLLAPPGVAEGEDLDDADVFLFEATARPSARPV